MATYKMVVGEASLGQILDLLEKERADNKQPPLTKCKIQWIDKSGTPTPDCSAAVYMATCNYPDGSKSPAIPCCREHYQRGIYFSNWSFEPIVIGANP